jgi:hypothetical protein
MIRSDARARVILSDSRWSSASLGEIRHQVTMARDTCDRLTAGPAP